jgi:hypothetical protein
MVATHLLPFVLLIWVVTLLHVDVLTSRRTSAVVPADMTSFVGTPDPPKTLVILIGNLRGGEKAWQTLYENLLDVNEADLALLIGETRESYQNATLFERAKYVWPIDEFDDWADAIDQINGTEWRQRLLPFLTDQSDGILGGVQDFKGSGAIIFMMRYFLSQHLQTTGLLKAYDRFVITRADHYYRCRHDLSLLSNHFIWLPRGEDWNGITDRHIVVPRQHVLAALDILPPVIQHPQQYSRLLREGNPEQLIRQRWKEGGLLPYVRRFDRMMFTCGETGDTSRWRQLGGEVEEGVRLKYEKEYKATYDTCGICRSPFFFVQKDSGRTLCLSDFLPYW